MGKDIIYVAEDPSGCPPEYYSPGAQCYQGVIPELLNRFSEQSRYDVRYYAPDQGDRREELAARSNPPPNRAVGTFPDGNSVLMLV